MTREVGACPATVGRTDRTGSDPWAVREELKGSAVNKTFVIV